MDHSALDFQLPVFLGIVLDLAFWIVGILLVTSQIAWPVIIVIFPLFSIYVNYQMCSIQLIMSLIHT